ncbi:MAG: VOC family protein [Actinomycetota bacterium]
MGHPHGLFGWAGVAVMDMEVGESFYKGLFGWEAMKTPGESIPYTIFTLDGEPVAGMGLLAPEDLGAGQPPAWSSYVIVDDVDLVAAKAKALGAMLLTEPMEIPDAGKTFFANDPAGAVVGFWEPGQFGGAGVFNVPGAMSWNELGCRDVEAAKAFYTELLGWGVDVQEHDGFVYTVVKVGDRMNGGIYDMTGILPDEIPAHWFVWFTVADADASAERAMSLGAKIERAPWDTMFGRMAVISDPQGPTFGIVQTPESE